VDCWGWLALGKGPAPAGRGGAAESASKFRTFIRPHPPDIAPSSGTLSNQNTNQQPKNQTNHQNNPSDPRRYLSAAKKRIQTNTLSPG